MIAWRGAELGKRERSQRSTREFSGLMDMFTILSEAMLSHVITCLIAHIKYVQFIVCQLYNKNKSSDLSSETSFLLPTFN